MYTLGLPFERAGKDWFITEWSSLGVWWITDETFTEDLEKEAKRILREHLGDSIREGFPGLDVTVLQEPTFAELTVDGNRGFIAKAIYRASRRNNIATLEYHTAVIDMGPRQYVLALSLVTDAQFSEGIDTSGIGENIERSRKLWDAVLKGFRYEGQ